MSYTSDYLAGQRSEHVFVDDQGYERDSGFPNAQGKPSLVHRLIAHEEFGKHDWPRWRKFGLLEVHHIDGNKRNNNPRNLQPLTRNEHGAVHAMNLLHGTHFEYPDEIYIVDVERERLIEEIRAHEAYLARRGFDETAREEDDADNEFLGLE